MKLLIRVLVLSAVLGASLASAAPFRGIEEELYPTSADIMFNGEEGIGVLATFRFSRDLTHIEQMRLVGSVLLTHREITGIVPDDWMFVATYITPRKSVSIVLDLEQDRLSVTEEWNEWERDYAKYRCKIWNGNVLVTLDYLNRGIPSGNRETHYGRDLGRHFEEQMNATLDLGTL